MKMKNLKKFFLIPACVIIAYCAQATEPQSKILSKKDFKAIEDRVESELKGKNLSNEKKFFLNLLAARELYQYRFFDKASHYYKNAIEMNVPENKTEAYINLMAIEISKGNKEKVRQLYSESKNYFSKNPQYKTADIDYYLKTIENYLPGNKNAPEVTGFYGRFAHEENLINLIKAKEYEKGLSLLNPDSIAHSTSDFNITAYDVLNVLVHGQNVKELYCDKQYKQYPNSFAMSTILCSLLNDHLKVGKFSEKNLKTANLYFKENSEKNYMFEALKEIEKK